MHQLVSDNPFSSVHGGIISIVSCLARVLAEIIKHDLFLLYRNVCVVSGRSLITNLVNVLSKIFVVS